MMGKWQRNPEFIVQLQSIRVRGAMGLIEGSEWTFDAFSKSESPIEASMCEALRFVRLGSWGRDSHPLAQDTLALGHQAPWDLTADPFPGKEWCGAFWPQVQIDDFRVDFLIMAKSTSGSLDGPDKIRFVRLIIECDGHEFHERTKEQAERDRSRDRALTAKGFTVLRFTGREINRDALACAREVERFLRGAL